MILTDKAKEDFLIRIYYQEETNQASDETIKEKVLFHAEKWFERKDERFKNALIIEWLDSVEWLLFQEILLEIYKDNYLMYPLGSIFKDAIEKANEIYNSL